MRTWKLSVTVSHIYRSTLVLCSWFVRDCLCPSLPCMSISCHSFSCESCLALSSPALSSAIVMSVIGFFLLFSFPFVTTVTHWCKIKSGCYPNVLWQLDAKLRDSARQNGRVDNEHISWSQSVNAASNRLFDVQTRSACNRRTDNLSTLYPLSCHHSTICSNHNNAIYTPTSNGMMPV